MSMEGNSGLPLEAKQEAEYWDLFVRAGKEIGLITRDEPTDDSQVRSVETELHGELVTFFKDEAKTTFGVSFLREKRFNVDVAYRFVDGKVIKEGSFGQLDDDYPLVIYRDQAGDIKGVEVKAAIRVGLDELRTLVDFIEHPLRGRRSFEALATFPDIDRLTQQ